jgi:hypothetical protein
MRLQKDADERIKLVTSMERSIGGTPMRLLLSRVFSWLSFCWLVWTPVTSHAEVPRSLCDAVLEGDIFNKILSNTSSSSSARQAFQQIMYSRSDDEAYETYSRSYESVVSQGQQGELTSITFSWVTLT